mmetsp:Transcript_12463/g.28433  ORF Transcript_12463/g.28433 Transcript_12463/m.28433 type:complete len:203 (+) Transcript_12463:394-1002(+)
MHPRALPGVDGELLQLLLLLLRLLGLARLHLGLIGVAVTGGRHRVARLGGVDGHRETEHVALLVRHAPTPGEEPSQGLTPEVGAKVGHDEGREHLPNRAEEGDERGEEGHHLDDDGEGTEELGHHLVAWRVELDDDAGAHHQAQPEGEEDADHGDGLNLEVGPFLVGLLVDVGDEEDEGDEHGVADLHRGARREEHDDGGED